MPYSAIQIANAFIGFAKDYPDKLPSLTPMKLQKLMFFAQSWYLKNNQEELFNDSFERWAYGPVLPMIYFEFKGFRAMPINRFGSNVFGKEEVLDQKRDINIFKFLQNIIDVYGKYSGSELSWMTHQKETAWDMGPQGSIINKEEMIRGKV